MEARCGWECGQAATPRAATQRQYSQGTLHTGADTSCRPHGIVLQACCFLDLLVDVLLDRRIERVRGVFTSARLLKYALDGVIEAQQRDHELQGVHNEALLWLGQLSRPRQKSHSSSVLSPSMRVVEISFGDANVCDVPSTSKQTYPPNRRTPHLEPRKWRLKHYLKGIEIDVPPSETAQLRGYVCFDVAGT